LVSSLVPRDHLPTAVAINSLVFNLARFIGPAIAGLIILRFDIAVLFLLNALTFVSLLFALSRLDLSAQPKGRDGAKPPPMLRAIGEGFRYVVNHPGICPLLVLAAVSAVMVRPLSELLPGIADELFERGAGGFAALSSVVGLGAVAGGLFLAQRDTRKDLTRTAMLASLLGTISGLCLALSPTFWMALIAAGAAGLGLVMAGVATQTLIQTSVDEAVRGRALSLLGLVIRSGPALGALVMGFVSEFTGLRWPLAVGALLSMLAWTIIWRHRQRMSDAMRPIRDRGSSPARPAP
jgi:MFS family permease